MYRTIAATFAIVFSFANSVFGQARNLPEEVKALAVLCSSGASIEFQGQLEGGINKLFGKVLSGKGDFSISKNEQEFLSGFQDENLKIVARKAYNDCVIEALKIIYNKREDGTLSESSKRILVPSQLDTVEKGQQFAMRTNNTVRMSNGEIFSVRADSRYEGVVDVKLNVGGKKYGDEMRIGDTIRNRRDNCWITYYAFNDQLFSFLYECG